MNIRLNGFPCMHLPYSTHNLFFFLLALERRHMWNSDGTFSARARPRSSGGGKQNLSVFGWEDELTCEARTPTNRATVNENGRCAAGLASNHSKNPSVPSCRPGNQNRLRDVLGSNIFSDEPIFQAKQLSACKLQELSGKSLFTEPSDVETTKEISQAKKESLYNSNVFTEDVDEPVKHAKISEMKRKSLAGSESQAILTGESELITDRRPLRRGNKEPGGGSHISFGESIRDPHPATRATPGGQSIIQFG